MGGTYRGELVEEIEQFMSERDYGGEVGQTQSFSRHSPNINKSERLNR
jgi:hypothetical protein